MTSRGDMSPQKVSDFELGLLFILSPNTKGDVNYGITMLWVKYITAASGDTFWDD